ncbi:oligosaccharide flippase family protein [Janibacter terrae]|uniref:Oligosaccharide flippase family protein n=1 Tax=Janibacter terrae TaxID=103817 RepID=A0ABZ2FGM0_9MICO
MKVAARLSPSRRGLLAIVGGTAAGQLIALVGAPIISRLYPPEVYGPFAVISALVLPAATVAALRYELAIAVPVEDLEARTLVSIGLRLSATLSVAAAVVIAAIHRPLGHLLGVAPDVASLLVWVPAIAGLMAGFTVLNQMAIRKRAYGAIARRNILQAGAVTVFQVVAGLLGGGAVGLAAGLALGQLVGLLSLAAALRPVLVLRVSKSQRRAVARRFRSFPLIMAPSGLINSLGLQAPLLLASALFGSTVAGWLGMTQRVIALPIALFGLTLAQVFLGEFGAARRGSTQDLQVLFLKTSRRLMVVGVVVGAVLMLAGPLIFSRVLGSEWRQSGVYSSALAIGLIVQMVASPLSQTIIVMGKNHYQAIWDVSRLVLCSLAVLVGFHVLKSDVGTMWLLGGITAFMYALLWGISWISVRGHAAAATPSLAAVSPAENP